MALDNTAFSSCPESLSLPVPEKGEEPVEEAPKDDPPTDVQNASAELGNVVTTETAPPTQPSSNNKMTFQAKMAAREAQANQPQKKVQGSGQEWSKFGWGKTQSLDAVGLHLVVVKDFVLHTCMMKQTELL